MPNLKSLSLSQTDIPLLELQRIMENSEKGIKFLSLSGKYKNKIILEIKIKNKKI